MILLNLFMEYYSCFAWPYFTEDTVTVDLSVLLQTAGRAYKLHPADIFFILGE